MREKCLKAKRNERKKGRRKEKRVEILSKATECKSSIFFYPLTKLPSLFFSPSSQRFIYV